MVGERHVQARQHAALRLGVEIDQRVAAGQQVDARDRGVADQVVAPKDDGAAQVLGQVEALARSFEVALEQQLRDLLELGPCIPRLPSLIERIIVDVGGEHLDPVAKLVLAEGLGEQHRDRVCLLAGRAAGRPGADRLLGALAVEQRRNQVLGDVAPHGWVAEEPRHVDQDRVEELAELFRRDLESIEVCLVVLDPDLLHALPDAPLER